RTQPTRAPATMNGRTCETSKLLHSAMRSRNDIAGNHALDGEQSHPSSPSAGCRRQPRVTGSYNPKSASRVRFVSVRSVQEIAMPSTPAAYSTTAKTIHWLMAALILISAGIGLSLEGIPRASAGRNFWTSQHEITGFLVIVLLLARISWRVTTGVPALPASMPRWQVQAAHFAHYGLYVLMLASPIVGMMLSSARGRIVSVWGLFNLPATWWQDRTWGFRLETVHSVLSWALLVVVAIHFLSALYHHFIARDDILRRMLPRQRITSHS